MLQREKKIPEIPGESSRKKRGRLEERQIKRKIIKGNKKVSETNKI